jgi:hypothetical protein
MVRILLDEISDLKSIRKVFMKKRDVREYDNSWQTVSQQHTEYDVDIVANIIAPLELNRLLSIEQNFIAKYPELIIKYNIIESDPVNKMQFNEPNAKLIYDSDPNPN